MEKSGPSHNWKGWFKRMCPGLQEWNGPSSLVLTDFLSTEVCMLHTWRQLSLFKTWCWPLGFSNGKTIQSRWNLENLDSSKEVPKNKRHRSWWSCKKSRNKEPLDLRVLQKDISFKHFHSFTLHLSNTHHINISTPKKISQKPPHDTTKSPQSSPSYHDPFLVASALSIFAQDSRRQLRLLASSKVTSSVTWPWDLELTKTKKPTTWVVLEYRTEEKVSISPLKAAWENEFPWGYVHLPGEFVEIEWYENEKTHFLGGKVDEFDVDCR